MAMLGHLHRTDVAVTRTDGVVLRFKTYQFSPGEWGWELVRANGDATSTQSDPNWRSEAEVIAAIHETAPLMGRVPGYGWVIVDDREPVPPAPGFR